MTRSLLLLATASLALAACSNSSPPAAAPTATSDSPKTATAATGDEAIRAALRSAGAPADPSLIRDTPIAGLKEAVVAGSIVYISADGRYLIHGQLSDVQSRRNLTADTEAELRKPQLDAVPKDGRIIFPAKNERHRVTVFTDVECGYCRQFHAQMAQYNDKGITVEYLFFPRGGMQSTAAKTSISVWCSDDRQAALTRAKQGQALPEKTCDNNVEHDYALGAKVGIRGTPAIFDRDGHMLGGYLPPDALLAALDQRRAPPDALNPQP